MDDKNKKNLNIRGLNKLIKLSNSVLKIVFVLAIALAIYIFIKLGESLKVFDTIINIIKVLAPLFIGIALAWLFNPVVKWIQTKKVGRKLAATIVYVVFVSCLVLILYAVIPTLYNQINDLVRVVPQIFDTIQKWITNIFVSLDNIDGFNANALKDNLFESLNNLGNGITSSLPGIIIGIVTVVFSGIGTIIIGLIIGYFLLISFEDTSNLIGFLPKKAHKMVNDLMGIMDNTLRNFAIGAILDSTFVFLISSISLYFVGLKSPLLFGLFCGITNVIPYAGPYIGGIPAVIVGFSQGIPTGILTLIVIVVIQVLEGNFLQPLILAKATKLHPISVIIGLLIFGHFFGIIGMLISTPLLGVIKAVFLYFNEKYDILASLKNVDEEK